MDWLAAQVTTGAGLGVRRCGRRSVVDVLPCGAAFPPVALHALHLCLAVVAISVLSRVESGEEVDQHLQHLQRLHRVSAVECSLEADQQLSVGRTGPALASEAAMPLMESFCEQSYQIDGNACGSGALRTLQCLL